MYKISIIKYSVIGAILNLNHIASADSNADPSTISSYSYKSFRDETKDKPWEFSLDITNLGCMDFQPTEDSSSFNASKLKNKGDEFNPKQVNAFVSAEFTASKEFFFLLQHKLSATLSRDYAAKELELAKYYWEADLGNNFKVKLGKDAGNFGQHLSAGARYTTHQLSFTHKLDNGIKYSFALEEACKIGTKTDDEKDEDDKPEYDKIEVLNTANEEVYIQNLKEKKEEKKWRTSQGSPKLALVGNLSYTLKNVFQIGFDAIGTYAEYYQSTKKNKEELFNNYMWQPLFAACVHAKYIVLHSENYLNGERFIIKGHAKYRSGCLAGYNPEAGGLAAKGSELDANVIFNSKDDFVTPIKTVGFGLTLKHFWIPFIYSNVTADALMAVKTNLEGVKEDKRILNAVKIKVAPVALQFGENFSIEPSYSLAAKNSFAKIGHRVELKVNVSM